MRGLHGQWAGAGLLPACHCGCRRRARRLKRSNAQRLPAPGLPAEEQDVGLGAVEGVVHPAAALLHAQRAPLGLRRAACAVDECIAERIQGGCVNAGMHAGAGTGHLRRPLPQHPAPTSLSSLPLGSWLAMSWGRITWRYYSSSGSGQGAGVCVAGLAEPACLLAPPAGAERPQGGGHWGTAGAPQWPAWL